jgi:hypothetical protein
MNPAVSHGLHIAQVIQLAVTPIFLLSGIGIILTLMTNRLARLVDRARKLEEVARAAAGAVAAEYDAQITVLAYRAALLNRAITLGTVSALLVALVVVTLFLSEFLEFDLSTPIATGFILAMFSLIGGLVFFLQEVLVAIRALRLGVRR